MEVPSFPLSDQSPTPLNCTYIFFTTINLYDSLITSFWAIINLILLVVQIITWNLLRLPSTPRKVTSMRMSSSFQTSIDDLAGIVAFSNNSNEWSFRGITISAEQYSGNIDADLAALPTEDISGNTDPAAAKGNQCHKLADGPARQSFFDRRLSASTCAATSYVDAEASMKLNYTPPSFESTSQFSTYIHTPTTSVDESGEESVSLVQDDSVELQQPSLYSRLPAYASGITPLESWYNEHERHELIAYKLSYHERDPMAQRSPRNRMVKRIKSASDRASR